ncbi:hypothetical protein DFH28DRAFT_706383 [Melampsora americana]|nr:hypothetical protein DFH28DRAFT_706383 [Melampsora americana]
MSSSTDLPPSLSAILALRPPLATSTRTDLAPSFKLLRSLVNNVYGSTASRGLEPGLWRAQLSRAAQRAAQLIQAVWSKLGGEAGVIVDEEGEGGRGVMRLQGVISDLQIFTGSLSSVQDPLSSLLLDSAAFTRTQATVNSLIKKLAGLVVHYKVTELITTPLSDWPEEDKVDKAEDLAALPLLIAKSRPSKAVLRKFEADLVLRESTAIDPENESSSDQINSTITPGSPPTSPDNSRRGLATQGLTAAKRSEFLRFVYSQNPDLVSSSQSLDTAVAVGTSALSSMNHPSRAPSSNGADDSRSSLGKPSLVQQRISNFATNSNAPAPLPTPLNLPASNRRIASDSGVASIGHTRKVWKVDTSELDAVQQRRSSGSFSQPRASLPPHVSITAPPARWRTSTPASVTSRTSLEDVVPELEKIGVKIASGVKRHSSITSVSDTSSDEPKPPAIASFAEQAAAIVAARQQRRTGTASSSASWTKPSLSRPGSSLANVASVAEPNADDSSKSIPPLSSSQKSDVMTSEPIETIDQTAPIEPPSLQPNPLSGSPASQRSTSPMVRSPSNGSQSTKQAEINSSEQVMIFTRPRPISQKQASITSNSTTPSSSVIGSPGALASRTLSPTIKSTILISRSSSIDRPGTALSNSNASVFSYSSNFPNTNIEPEPDFEMVADLIEDRSLIDVIVGPPSPTLEATPEVPEPPISSEETNPEPLSSPTTEPAKKSVVSQASKAEEESSLADLLERATLFENWDSIGIDEPSEDLDKTETMDGYGQHQLTSPSSVKTTLSNNMSPPAMNGSLTSTRVSPVVQHTSQSYKSPSAGSLSPPMSAQIRTPMSPPSTGSSLGGFRRHVPSLQPTSPLSPNSEMSRQPIDATLSSHSMTGLSAGGGPSSPTRSFSGQSWATSLMSASPAAVGDFDLHSINNYAASGMVTEGAYFTGDNDHPPRHGWRILSLDGGGIRGLSTLFVIRNLLERVQRRTGSKKVPLPSECFDVICGVGTGGIIALLIGRLKFGIDDAIEAYLSISRKVFGQAKGALAVLMGKTRYSASKLESAMQEVIQRAEKDGRASLTEGSGDEEKSCRTFVMAMRKSEGSEGTFRTLRSYSTRQVLGDRCSIYQAARATSASPLFFKPVNMGDSALSSVPRSASLNNPALEAVNEARSLYSDRPIDCLISIGAGKTEERNGTIGRACGEISDACENAASGVEAVAGAEGWLRGYGRLNVKIKNHGNFNEWDLFKEIQQDTLDYLMNRHEAGFELMERLVDVISEGLLESGTL